MSVLQKMLTGVGVCVVGPEFVSTSPTFVRGINSCPADQRPSSKTELDPHF